MILLIHRDSKKLVKASRGGLEISADESLCKAFWELAAQYPEELIGWCNEKFVENINYGAWEEIFHHDLIMASYSIENSFFPDSIGYIDSLPFINVNRRVRYGTWLMSSDMGGIKGEVLLQFREMFKGIKDFGFLLNSIAKVGQQNSLLCYSDPALCKNKGQDPFPVAGTAEVFRFVYQHYNTAWTPILLLAYILYERSFPLLPLVRAFFHPKFFRKKVDLTGFSGKSSRNLPGKNVDVIIPTMGRPEYLRDVLEDLGKQSLKPATVIIVEQDREPNSTTALPFLQEKSWPFEIIHHFIHQTGACNARNLALEESRSEWIFFADDDIRIKPNFLEQALKEAETFGLNAINMNCRQAGEKTVFDKRKQWGSFGSGTSLVNGRYARECRYSLIYEHGNGEDADYGMQLRNIGCDIVYSPELELLHLKAPIGGFRKKITREWENDHPAPKPSPTVMAFALRNYTAQQLKGYKLSLNLRYYREQSTKNPIRYIQEMNRRWEQSMKWAEKLIREDSTTFNKRPAANLH